jgi:hypothetical protein
VVEQVARQQAADDDPVVFVLLAQDLRVRRQVRLHLAVGRRRLHDRLDEVRRERLDDRLRQPVQPLLPRRADRHRPRVVLLQHLKQ